MPDAQARLAILIAHHDAAVGGRLCSLLFEAGHTPQLVGTRAAALERARATNPSQQQTAAIALTVLQRQVELGWRRADLVEAFSALVQRGQLPGLLAEAAVIQAT